MSEKIQFDEEPMKWTSLHSAAEGNIITAIKQLKRLEGFDFEQILGVFSLHLYKEFKKHGTKED